MKCQELNRPLISVHFPKAGGSSFQSALQEAYGLDNVLRPNDCDPVDPSNPRWIHPTWFRNNLPVNIDPFKAVHGHIAIQKYELVPNALRIVMLREPVENLISIYYYWRSTFEATSSAHGIYEFVKKQRLSLLEVAEIPKLRFLMSETYFGGFDMRRFNIIGAHDRRAEFITAVSKAAGVPLSTINKENVTPPSEERDNVASDTKLIAKLRDLLQNDIRFYETQTCKG